MSSSKWLILMLMVALVLTVLSGYRSAYFGPFYVVQLHEAGYTAIQISQIFMIRSVINALLFPFYIAVPIVTCYYLGRRYRLTLISTVVFIATLCAACTVGQMIGYAIYQIQAMEYPVLFSMWYQAFFVSGTFTWSLVGALAGNYKREVDKKEFQNLSRIESV